jgi:subtilisin
MLVEGQTYVETWGVKHIKADVVHGRGNTGGGIKGCIVDTGGPVGNVHEDIVSAGGQNFVTPGNDWSDDNKHGTHVHGIFAALLNGLGVAGVGPHVDIYHAKVLDTNGNGAWDTILDGLQFCIDLTEGSTVPVVSNHSYGGSGNPGAAVELAYQMTADAGVHLICAAGNSGRGNGDTVTYPAKFSSCVAVASIDIDGQQSSFSSVGAEVEVAAPGGNIHSTLPNNTYGNLSGTSMASPHVAGVFALAVAAGITDPRSIIPRSTDRGNRDADYGFGVIDADKMVRGGEDPPPPLPPPSPDPDLPPTNPGTPINIVGGSMSFDGSPSFDPDGQVVLYDWWVTDFDRWLGPNSGPTLGVGFGNRGVRNVHIGLRVTDNVGATGVKWRYFRIFSELDNPPPPPPPEENIPPEADYTFKPDPAP